MRCRVSCGDSCDSDPNTSESRREREREEEERRLHAKAAWNSPERERHLELHIMLNWPARISAPHTTQQTIYPHYQNYHQICHTRSSSEAANGSQRQRRCFSLIFNFCSLSPSSGREREYFKIWLAERLETDGTKWFKWPRERCSTKCFDCRSLMNSLRDFKPLGVQGGLRVGLNFKDPLQVRSASKESVGWSAGHLLRGICWEDWVGWTVLVGTVLVGWIRSIRRNFSKLLN